MSLTRQIKKNVFEENISPETKKKKLFSNGVPSVPLSQLLIRNKNMATSVSAGSTIKNTKNAERRGKIRSLRKTTNSSKEVFDKTRFIT